MKNRRNFYRILQVQPDAPIEIIRASYRTLMRELKQHPDLGGSTYAATLLNEAYQTLSDPVRRAEYDRELSAKYTKNAAPRDGEAKSPLATLFCPSCRRPLARKAPKNSACPACGGNLSTKDTEVPAPHWRSVARILKEGRILIRTSQPQKAMEAELIDLSPKGMRFRCSAKLTKGTILNIDGPQFQATASVTNVHPETIGRRHTYAIGVSFLEVSFEESKGTFLSTSA